MPQPLTVIHNHSVALVRLSDEHAVCLEDLFSQAKARYRLVD